jgi:hypothetical protein
VAQEGERQEPEEGQSAASSTDYAAAYKQAHPEAEVDPHRAEHMAHAEKPHVEDAIAIEEMRNRAVDDIAAEDQRVAKGEISSKEAFENYQSLRDKTLSLEEAQDASLDVAEKQSKLAGRAYDEAEVKRRSGDSN